MHYTNIATISCRPGRLREFLLAVERELLPTYREALGFVAFTIARTSDSTAISCSIWQTHHQAEQATRMIEASLKDFDKTLIASYDTHVGDLPFIAFTGDLVNYGSAPVAPAGRSAPHNLLN